MIPITHHSNTVLMVLGPDGIYYKAGLSGLGLFKSKSRKKAEKELPALQKKVAEQAHTINMLNRQVTELQKLIAQRDQSQAALQQRLQAGTSQSANPPAQAGSKVLGYIGAAALISFLGYQVYQQRKIKKQSS